MARSRRRGGAGGTSGGRGGGRRSGGARGPRRGGARALRRVEAIRRAARPEVDVAAARVDGVEIPDVGLQADEQWQCGRDGARRSPWALWQATSHETPTHCRKERVTCPANFPVGSSVCTAHPKLHQLSPNCAWPSKHTLKPWLTSQPALPQCIRPAHVEDCGKAGRHDRLRVLSVVHPGELQGGDGVVGVPECAWGRLAAPTISRDTTAKKGVLGAAPLWVT